MDFLEGGQQVQAREATFPVAEVKLEAKMGVRVLSRSRVPRRKEARESTALEEGAVAVQVVKTAEVEEEGVVVVDVVEE